MADSFKITDGTTEFELEYAAGSQEDYKLQYGTRIGNSEPDVLVHNPDFGETQPIRAVDRDREVYLTINADGADWDDVFDNVTRIKRMVDGANSQALRYWTVGDVDRVVLRVQKDGATNYTDLPIKWGFVDDSAAYHTEIQSSITGWKIVIMLVVGPYGEGAEITLRNDMASSPHFVEDSNSDGLADGWSAVGSPTTALDTTYYLVGGSSQKMTTDASSGQYIQCDAVAASVSSDIVAYIWMAEPTGTGDALTLTLRDGSNNVIDTATFDPTSPAGYDKTATGPGGATWYRYAVSGSNTLAGSAYIRIIRAASGAAAATAYYFDAAYLEVGQTVTPDAWCSTPDLENRYDPDSSNEDHINYIDVWGVPGDAAALLKTEFTGSSADLVYMSKHIPRKYSEPVFSPGHPPRYWFSANDDTGFSFDKYIDFTFSTGSESSVSDATREGGDYRRYTAATPAVTGTIDFHTWGNLLLSWGDTPLRVYLIARSSSAATTMELADVTSARYGIVDKQQKTFNAANTWELVDLGIIQPYRYTAPSGGLPILGREVIEIDCTPGASAATVDVDAVMLFPMDAVKTVELAGSGFLSSPNNFRVGDVTGYNVLEYIGGIWDVMPDEWTRFYFATSAADFEHTLTDDFSLLFTITPRTRHLLGTI